MQQLLQSGQTEPWATTVAGKKLASNREKPWVGPQGGGQKHRSYTEHYVIYWDWEFKTLYSDIQDKCVELVGYKISWMLHFYCAVLLRPTALYCEET